MITQARLQELLHYNHQTGIFVWIAFAGNGGGSIRIGDVAGTQDTYGYIQITVAGTLYLAHRLAWLYMTGVWPTFEIDHRNRTRNDNRWDNLRPSTRPLNIQNRLKASAKNSTGLLGVSHSHGRFCARITVDGKSHFLGDYDTPEAAHSVYLEAKKRLHPGFAS